MSGDDKFVDEMIPYVEFADNANERTPCVLVLDCSGSMRGEPIKQLNAGLKALEKELKEDIDASSRVQLLIIKAFGKDEAVISSDWVDAMNFEAPEMEAGGLTPLGKEAVREMERTGVAVDVSHLSRRGFRDVAGIARAPFLASHSNCNAVYRHPRSLTDRQIDCIITRGGLIGINLYRAFLGRPGSAGFAAAHRHIRHVLERGGEHVLALGSDFDGCELEPCFAGVEKLEAFQDYLLANGMPQEQADALFYKNAEKFFQTLLQPQTDMLK